MAPKPRPLNLKQQEFVKQYLSHMNATEAYLIAYKITNRGSAKTLGGKLLSNVAVRGAIDKARKACQSKTVLTAQKILDDLELIKQRCLQGIPVTDKDGNPTGEWRFEAFAAIKACELQGKHIGIWDGKQSEDDTEDDEPLANSVSNTMGKLGIGK